MIVCVCHRISDREIRRMAHQGCESFDDLQMDSGVATCCGQCESCAREVFAQAKAAHGVVAAIHPPESVAKIVK
ncbi:MAG TPA: (2Fe-2S)-binding protein [Aquabacterium sp.]|nr:(2Fe-2S)-binding protein [Aquabacterium sp.]